MIKDDELLEKFDGVWNNVSNNIYKKNESKPIYNKKLLKSKIKTYTNEAADFGDEEVPDVGSNYTYLAIILIDFVLKKDENYYPQVFLKEFKYIRKK